MTCHQMNHKYSLITYSGQSKQKCVIETPDESNTFIAKALAKKGAVNGTVLTSGEELSITLRNMIS